MPSHLDRKHPRKKKSKKFMLYNNKHVFVLNESCQAILISFCDSISHSLIRKKEQVPTVIGIGYY